MKHPFWLAGLCACALTIGCAEPVSSEQAAADSETAAAPDATLAKDDSNLLAFVAEADFRSLLDSNPVVVVDFTADW